MHFHAPLCEVRITPHPPPAESGVSSITLSTQSITALMINITTTAITASASASSSVVEDTIATPLAGTKRLSSSLDLPFLLPSPSKKYPDYSVTKSTGDSVATCDDSGQWEAEGEHIFQVHMRKNEEEAAAVAGGMNDILTSSCFAVLI
jgi:hypothetical protein